MTGFPAVHFHWEGSRWNSANEPVAWLRNTGTDDGIAQFAIGFSGRFVLRYTGFGKCRRAKRQQKSNTSEPNCFHIENCPTETFPAQGQISDSFGPEKMFQT
jgi:hypothetical protein